MSDRWPFVKYFPLDSAIYNEKDKSRQIYTFLTRSSHALFAYDIITALADSRLIRSIIISYILKVVQYQ